MKVMGNVVLRPAPRIDSARAGWLAQQAAHSVTHGHQSHRTAARLEAGERGLIDKTDRQDLGLGLVSARSEIRERPYAVFLYLMLCSYARAALREYIHILYMAPVQLYAVQHDSMHDRHS